MAICLTFRLCRCPFHLQQDDFIHAILQNRTWHIPATQYLPPHQLLTNHLPQQERSP